MKKHLLPILALCVSTVIAADVVEKTTTKTTTTTGTLSEFAPGTTFVVKETTGPVTYRYGKTVSYVTKSGKALSDEEVRTRIRVGIPVSVHYITEGDARVVNRVVIDDNGDRTETTTETAAPGTVTKTTKTTTTTSGTLSEYTPGTTFIVKETTGPVKYRYGKTVTYVTKNGTVLREDDVRTRIKAGIPVRVKYDLDGDVRIVNTVEIDD